MYSTIRSLFVVVAVSFLAVAAFPASAKAMNPEKCAEELAQIQQIEDAEAKLKKLKRLCKKCKKHAPTLVAGAEALLEAQTIADEQWLSRSVEYLALALEADPDHSEAHWWLGSLGMFLGEYETAAPHFRWLADHPAASLPDSVDREIILPLLQTCEFIGNHCGRHSGHESSDWSKIAARLEPSDSAIAERARFRWIARLSCAVAKACGLTLREGDGKHVEVALQFLEKWPKRGFISARQDRITTVAGLVSTITAIALDSGKATEVSGLLANAGLPAIDRWPEAHFGGTLETTFRSHPIDTLSTFDVQPDLSAKCTWQVPDLEGPWDVTAQYHRTGLNSTETQTFTIDLKQQGDTAEIVIPRVPEQNVMAARMVFAIDGRELRLVSWETIGHIGKDSNLRPSGKLVLLDTDDLLAGYLVRSDEETFESDNRYFYFSLYFREAEGGFYSLKRRN